MRKFHIATAEEIKNGKTTDIYFVRTKEILHAKGRDRVWVAAEVTSGAIPDDHPWGVLCGVEEVAHLLEGIPVDVYSMPEGSIFHPSDHRGFREPVLMVEGAYSDFCLMETPMLGLLCQESGVATRAARVRLAAGERLTVSFGIRRMHPALAPAIDRAAYIGGMDGVSSLIGAEVIGGRPMGTMPHALIIALGDQTSAWRGFHEVMEPEVPRIALVDTYFDEKTEAIMAAEALGKKLQGVRLDTPGSRKGNFAEIVREVRWELDIRGYNHVRIFVSGGLDDEAVKALGEAGADAFGVGTWVSSAPTVDFALDIVEVEGRPAAKRGKLGGKKQVYRCPRCLIDLVKPWGSEPPSCPCCGGETEPMLKPLIKGGEIVADLPEPKKIRGYVLDQLKRLSTRGGSQA
ncbi:MAG: nicotinate phosphoribosyltransferase [Candidatus Bathyarchaeia archaeon]